MSKKYQRTPRGYNGQQLTSRQVREILPGVLAKIGEVYEVRPDLIMAAWPDLIGPKLAAMTRAQSFCDGILYVKVKNSTLHSLLSQNDKPRLLKGLRARFPKVEIKTIVFRIG